MPPALPRTHEARRVVTAALSDLDAVIAEQQRGGPVTAHDVRAIWRTASLALDDLLVAAIADVSTATDVSGRV